MLHTAVDRVRFRLSGSGQNGSLRALGSGGNHSPEMSTLLARRFAVGTLGGIRYVIQGMRDLPGRKSLVLFSDGMAMFRNSGSEEPPVTPDEVRGVSDRANRSAVVIYSVDPRGVVYPGLQAQDVTAGMAQEETCWMRWRQEKSGSVPTSKSSAPGCANRGRRTSE